MWSFINLILAEKIMEDLLKELESVKQAAAKSIYSLFKEAGCKTYKFVDSDRKLTVSGDFENPVVNFVNADNTTESVTEHSVRDLDALIGHLRKNLPTFKIKQAIHQLLVEQPVKPLDLPYLFFQDQEDTYRVLTINSDPFQIELFTPFYDEEKYENFTFLSVWDINDIDFLNKLYEVVVQRLDADNFSMIPTETKDAEVEKAIAAII